jgi:hypothetical protein
MFYSRALQKSRSCFRLVVGPVAIAFCFSVNRAAAQTNEFIPDVPSIWENSMNLRGGFGFKDNLLLSRTNREESPLILSGIDFSLYRLPLDGKQFTLFITGEDTRFLEGHEVKSEQYAAALAEFRMDLGPKWNAGTLAQYVYQDQIFDVSTIEATTGPVRVQGHRVGLWPSVRWNFSKDFWLQAEPRVSRQFYKEPLDDYWEPGGKLTLSHDYGFRSTISFGYAIAQLIFDTREQLALDGTALPGQPLEYTQYEPEILIRHNWDARRRWRTTTRLSFQLNEDNGPGFFDYYRYQAAQQVRYVNDRWDVKASGKASYYDFVRQPATLSDPSSREKTLLTFLLRVDRKLMKHLKIFAEFEHEHSLSNRPSEEYRVNRIVGGIDVEL